MFFRLGIILKQARKKIWVRSSFFALLALFAVSLGVILDPFIPDWLQDSVGFDSVSSLLSILSSSMLAITTFSLSIAVSAYGNAANSATPRATQILMEDSTTQNVLSTFLGSFIFGLVGGIALNFNIYDEKSAVILFIVTLFVISLIIFTFIRWIEHISSFGRIQDTVSRVEKSTLKSVDNYYDNFIFTANSLLSETPTEKNKKILFLDEIGYVQNINLELINSFCLKENLKAHILTSIGSFSYKRSPALTLEFPGTPSEDLDISILKKAFQVEESRSYDKDPRFGLIILSQIADRALSLSVNDMGTVIDLLPNFVKVLTHISEKERKEEPLYKNIFISDLKMKDLFKDCFAPIVRDGQGAFELQIKLQKTFLALSKTNPAKMAEEAFNFSKNCLEKCQRSNRFSQEEMREMEQVNFDIKQIVKSIE